MIFVTVGTTSYPFIRMSDFIYSYARENLETYILFQHGETDVEWKLANVEKVKFLDFSQHKAAIKKATMIISHGGPATIYLAVNFNKKPFVMPRERRFGEHINNHQVYFVQMLIKKKMVLPHSELSSQKPKLELKVPTKYGQNQRHRLRITNFLDTFCASELL